MRMGGSTTAGKADAAALPRNASTPQPTSRASDRGVQCAVLFLDVVRYSEQPFADQVEIKQRINAAVLEATRHLTPDDRILLDTGDGVAISFQSNPEDALFVALSLGQALGAPANGQAVAIRTGINFGKVSVLRDLNGQPSVIGDGINMAQRVMSFANPGQLLISRAFYQVLVAQSEDYAAMFTYCGSRTDKHVREHELFEFATPLRDMGQLALPAVMVSARARHPSLAAASEKRRDVGAPAHSSPNDSRCALRRHGARHHDPDLARALPAGNARSGGGRRGAGAASRWAPRCLASETAEAGAPAAPTSGRAGTTIARPGGDPRGTCRHRLAARRGAPSPAARFRHPRVHGLALGRSGSGRPVLRRHTAAHAFAAASGRASGGDPQRRVRPLSHAGADRARPSAAHPAQVRAAAPAGVTRPRHCACQ